MIDRALANGVCVSAWSCDELYGRSGPFLDALEQRHQMFVAEIPNNFHGWARKPKLLHAASAASGRGRPKGYPRLAAGSHSSEVRNLARHSPAFREQVPQRYRIKETGKGPEVWEVRWGVVWRKNPRGFPGRRHCLIVARNVLSGEEKYFLANRLPGERNPATGRPVTLRFLLRVAFGRCSIESCFRQAKDELGMDHYEVRGWRCLHRHFYVTQLSHLFCARLRQECAEASGEDGESLTAEQIRSAVNVWLEVQDLPPAVRRRRYQAELDKQHYYQRRNEQARRSHTKAKLERLHELGIAPSRIKSCVADTPRPSPESSLTPT